MVCVGEDIALNSRVFLWPKDMEQVLDLSATRIAHRREIAEGVLRNKGAEFEQVYVTTTLHNNIPLTTTDRVL